MWQIMWLRLGIFELWTIHLAAHPINGSGPPCGVFKFIYDAKNAWVLLKQSRQYHPFSSSETTPYQEMATFLRFHGYGIPASQTESWHLAINFFVKAMIRGTTHLFRRWASGMIVKAHLIIPPLLCHIFRFQTPNALWTLCFFLRWTNWSNCYLCNVYG